MIYLYKETTILKSFKYLLKITGQTATLVKSDQLLKFCRNYRAIKELKQLRRLQSLSLWAGIAPSSGECLTVWHLGPDRIVDSFNKKGKDGGRQREIKINKENRDIMLWSLNMQIRHFLRITLCGILFHFAFHLCWSILFPTSSQSGQWHWLVANWPFTSSVTLDLFVTPPKQQSFHVIFSERW